MITEREIYDLVSAKQDWAEVFGFMIVLWFCSVMAKGLRSRATWALWYEGRSSESSAETSAA